MDFFESQWASALADLKDAAHDSGRAIPDETDAWSVQHDGERGAETHSFGYYLADGTFRHIAFVSSPDALRNLRLMFEFTA